MRIFLSFKRPLAGDPRDCKLQHIAHYINFSRNIYVFCMWIFDECTHVRCIVIEWNAFCLLFASDWINWFAARLPHAYVVFGSNLNYNMGQMVFHQYFHKRQRPFMRGRVSCNNTVWFRIDCGQWCCNRLYDVSDSSVENQFSRSLSIFKSISTLDKHSCASNA